MRISDWSSDVCSSDLAAGRVPVIAGCGSNDTVAALEHMQAAQAAGADAALVVAPYYNKPNQEGVFRHFAYLAQNSALPILLYNVPSRTITDISVDVMKRLRAYPTRSEEHTSELQSLMRISYAVFCLKNKTTTH